MPSEIRVIPAARRPASDRSSTVSGLASTVTSQPGASPNSPSIARSIAARSPAGSSVGVPPPKNTVAAGGAAGPSTRRAKLTSAAARLA